MHRLAILLLSVATLTLSLRLAHATTAKAAAGAAVSITNAWARATVPGQEVGAAYLTITNRGADAEALLGASSPMARSVAIHRTTIDGGMSRMRPAGQILIAPGATLRIEPSSLHLMLVGLNGPLIAGKSIPLTLHLRSAGDKNVQLLIRPLVDAP